MKKIIELIKGIFIGAGAILPGISSGVLCVILGIYEKLLNSVLGFFKNPKKNFAYLFPIVLGIGIGVFLFGRLLKFLFASFYMPTCFAFIGLILGSIPLIFKQAHKEHKPKLSSILCLLLTFSFSLYLVALEQNSHFLSTYYLSFPILILDGFIMSIGIVVPGVSSSVILMILGIYETYLQAISTLDFGILIPLGIGIIIGGLIFLKIIQFLFKYFNQATYYSIIGFVLGSVFVLYPRLLF